MELCDLTLSTPEENLAGDEVLLDLCEAEPGRELLRFWEPAQYFVVVGYANAVGREVNFSFCQQHRIPVLRRCSGGGTVLQGPGCLNYSLVLRIEPGTPLHSISGTNDFILERLQGALGALLQARVEKQGHTDLAIGGLKFCGNAQRRRQHCLLFHGALLLDMDIGLVEKALPMPSKQPDYRLNRSHTDFLVNLKTPAERVKDALARAWNARQRLDRVPLATIQRLAQEKYGLDEWNLKF